MQCTQAIILLILSFINSTCQTSRATDQTVTNKTARAISVLLHPLLMPTLLYAILFYFSPSALSIANPNSQWLFLLLIFITTFLIPLVGIWLLHRMGAVNSLTMDNKNERFLPFLATTFFYMLATYLFINKLNSYYATVVILGSITLSIAIVTIVSLFWKISAHSVGICGVIGFLFGLYYKNADTQLFYPILGVIVIAGLLMSARLSLNAHNPMQILIGAIVGWVISFGSIYWLL